MKAPNGLSAWLIDLVVVMSGVIFLLVMESAAGVTIRNLFQAIGTGLVAAGFISYLFRISHTPREHAGVQIVAEDRLSLENEYVRLKRTAREIDIVGIALSHALGDLVGDPNQRVLHRVLFERAKVRLLFLSPTAPYVEQRAAEDGVPVTELQTNLRNSIRTSVEVYERLRKLYESAVETRQVAIDKTGSFEIRIMNMCPYCTIHRTDDLILWGIYTAAAKGFDCAVLRVDKQQDLLFSQLCSHFDALWNKSLSEEGDSDFVVRYHASEGLKLNGVLLEKVLGSGWQSASTP